LSPDLQRAANPPPKNNISDNSYYVNRAQSMPKLAPALFAPGSAVRSPLPSNGSNRWLTLPKKAARLHLFLAAKGKKDSAMKDGIRYLQRPDIKIRFGLGCLKMPI
jgi:hypothetical protein